MAKRKLRLYLTHHHVSNSGIRKYTTVFLSIYVHTRLMNSLKNFKRNMMKSITVQ